MNESVTAVQSTSTATAARSSSSFRFPMKLLPVFIGIAISIVMIIVVAVTIFGKDPYDEAVKLYAQGHYMYDAAAVEHIAPDTVWNELALASGISKDTTVDYLNENAFIHTENLYAEFGGDVILSHDITDKDKMNKDELATYAQTVSDNYGIPASEITQAAVLTVEITIEGADGTQKVDEETLTVMMIDGVCYAEEGFETALHIAKIAGDFYSGTITE